MALGDVKREIGSGGSMRSGTGSGRVTTDQVNELYKKYLGRDAAQDGLDYWSKIASDNNFSIEQLEGSFKNAAKQEINNAPDRSLYPVTDINTKQEVDYYNTTKKQEKSLEDLTKQMTDYFTPKKEGELTPEAINQYADIVKQSLMPSFQKEAQGISEQYAAMGRDPQGDAYNRALAKLGGDFQSKQFEQSLGLAQANIGTKNQNIQNYLGMINSQKTPSWTQQQNWSEILGNKDWTKQSDLAKELAGIQNQNQPPSWMYLLDPIAKIAGSYFGAK